MLKQLIEHREMRMLRKDHQRKQSLKYMGLCLLILVAMLIATGVGQLIAPQEVVRTEAKGATPVKTATPTISASKQQEIDDIDEFAFVVTKPLEDLTKEDLALVDRKSEDPCYAKNATLPRAMMIDAILACKGLKP